VTHYTEAEIMLLRDRDTLNDNLTATQARCTELLDEARANRLIANAPPGELVALSHISHERRLQDAKWGSIETHTSVPDGTGDAEAQEMLALTRDVVSDHQYEVDSSTCCWRHVLEEEFADVLAESDPKKLRAELVQLGACCVQWIEALDIRANLRPLPAIGGIPLPGWHCVAQLEVSDGETTRTERCGAFNGAGKEWLAHCRACGASAPGT
jgi:hypothetical protein